MSYYSDVALLLTTEGAKELRKALDHDGKAILNGYSKHYKNDKGELFLWEGWNHWPDDIAYALEEIDPYDYQYIRIGEQWDNEVLGHADVPGLNGWMQPVWQWADGKEPEEAK